MFYNFEVTVSIMLVSAERTTEEYVRIVLITEFITTTIKFVSK